MKRNVNNPWGKAPLFSAVTDTECVIEDPSCNGDDDTNDSKEIANTTKGTSTSSSATPGTSTGDNKVTTTQNASLSLAEIMAEQERESKLHMQRQQQQKEIETTFESEEDLQLRLAIEASLQMEQQRDADVKQPASEMATETEEERQTRLAIEASLFISEESDKKAVATDEMASACATESPKPIATPPPVASATSAAVSVSAAAVPTEASSAATSASCGLSEEELAQIQMALKESDDAEDRASLELALLLQEEETSKLKKNTQRQEQLINTLQHVGVTTVTSSDFYAMKNGSTGNTFTTFDDRIKKSSAENEGMKDGEYNNEDDDDGAGYYEDGYRINNMNNQVAVFGTGSGITPAAANSCTGIDNATNAWTKIDDSFIVGPGGQVRTKHDIQLKYQSNARRLGLIDEDAMVNDTAYNSLKSKMKKGSVIKGVVAHGTGRSENTKILNKTRQGALDGAVMLQIQKAITSGIISQMNGVVKEGKEALVYHANSAAAGAFDSVCISGKSIDNSDNFDVAIKIFKNIQEFKQRGKYVDGDPRYYQYSKNSSSSCSNNGQQIQKGKFKFSSLDKRTQVEVWAEKEYRNLVRAYKSGISCPRPIDYRKNIIFMRFLGQDGWPSPQIRELDLKRGSKKWKLLYYEILLSIRKLYHIAKLVHGDLSEYNILLVPSYLLLQDIARSNNSDDSGSKECGEGEQEQKPIVADHGQTTDIAREVRNDSAHTIDNTHVVESLKKEQQQTYDNVNDNDTKNAGVRFVDTAKTDINKNNDNDEDAKSSLQTVLIDFGTAVHIGHPCADEFLDRDIKQITAFFKGKGIRALGLESARNFILSTRTSVSNNENGDEYDDDEEDNYRDNDGIIVNDCSNDNDSGINNDDKNGPRKIEITKNKKNWIPDWWDEKKDFEELESLLDMK